MESPRPDLRCAPDMRWNKFTDEPGNFRFEYPAIWDYEIIEHVPSFFDPIGGSGAFQAVYWLHRGGTVEPLPVILGQHLNRMGLASFTPDQADIVRLGDIDFASNEFRLDDRFWFVALARRDQDMVLFSYNSDEEPDDETAGILSHMVSSLRIRPAGAPFGEANG